jgi:hypothetical protein
MVASAYIAEKAERDTPPWRKNPATNSEMRNDCPGADAVYATVAEASARALPSRRPAASLVTRLVKVPEIPPPQSTVT